LITGTVPDDENATAHPAGATTSNGMVTLTEPFVVDEDAVVVVDVDDVDGDCAPSCAAPTAANSTNRNNGTECRVFAFIVGPF
jgi:hypothetical protein